MTTSQFVIALITGLPGLLAAIGALYHSVATRSMMKRQFHLHSDEPYDGKY